MSNSWEITVSAGKMQHAQKNEKKAEKRAEKQLHNFKLDAQTWNRRGDYSLEDGRTDGCAEVDRQRRWQRRQTAADDVDNEQRQQQQRLRHGKCCCFFQLLRLLHKTT